MNKRGKSQRTNSTNNSDDAYYKNDLITRDIRKIGIPPISNAPWGTHFCQFYQTKEDLIDILVPYFKTGLENNEFCMWITSDPLRTDEAKKALSKKVNNLEKYIQKGQIEILDSSEWYTKSGRFNSDEVLSGWVNKEAWAREKGFDGLRLTGNTFWLEKKDWEDFTKYEESVNSVIGKYHMIAICSYSLDKCNASEIIDVVSNHQFALIKKDKKWHRIENPELKKVEDSLKAQRELFETVVNSMPAAVNLIRGSDLRIQLINPAYQVIAPGKQMIGKTLDELWPETGQNFAKLCKDVLDTGKSYHVNDELNMIRRHPDGPAEPAYFSWSLYRVRLPGDDGWGILNTAWETTQRKKAEEERLRNMKIFDQIQDGIIISDPSYRITYWNKGAEKIYGYSESEAIGKVSFELLQPTYAPGEREKIINELKLTGTSKSLIHTKHRNGTSIYTEAHATRLINDNGKISGYVVTNRDVTETQKMQNSLTEAEKKYRTVAENTYDFEFWLDPRGKYLYVSPSCKRLTGFSADQYYSQPDLRQTIIHPDDKQMFMNHVKNEVSKKKPGELEHRIIHNDGSIRWIHHVCQPIWDENGQFLGIRGSNRDITKNKQMAETLERQHNELETIFDTVPASIFYKDTQNRFLRVNKAFTTMMDLPKEELEGKSLFDLYPKDQAEAFWKDDKEVIESGQQKINIIEPVETKKGLLWVQTHKIPYRDTAGNIIGVVGFTIDISERKKAEEQLRETTEYLDNLLNYANAPIIVWDNDFKIIRFNHAFEHLTGYTSKEVIGKNLDLLFPKDTKEKSLQKIQQTLGGEYWESVEIPILQKNGQIRIALWNSANIYDRYGNKLLATIAQGQDITERKQTEESLYKSELRLKLAQVSAGAGLWDWDLLSGKLEWSDELYCLFGLDSKKPQATFDIWRSVIHPEDTQKAEERIQNAINNRIPLTNEYRVILPSGEIRWINALGSTTYDDTGKPIRMTGICLDITERKRNEEIIKENEARLKHAQEIAHLGSWELDLITNHLSWSDEVFRIFGLQSQEFPVTYERFLERVHPEDRAIVDSTYTNSIREGKNSYDIEHRILRKNGEIRFVHEKCEHVRNDSGDIIRSVGMIHDITDARKAQTELVRLASFPEKNPNPIIELNLSGKIEYLNPISKGLFLDIEKKQFDHPFLKGINNIITEIQEQKYPRFREIKCKEKYYHQSITYIPESKRIIIYSTDITSRKHAEEELEKSEKKYRLIVENSMYVIMMTQPDGIISYISPSSKELLGYPPEELIGTNPSIAYPDDEKKVHQALTRALNGEKDSGFEYRILTKQGEVRWVSHSWSPIFLNETLQSIISVVVDITDRKSSEEKIKKLNENLIRRSIELVIANKELETFSYSVSHDLRAPLRSIDGFSQALLEDYAGKLDKQGEEYLHRVRNATKRMEQLIDDLLRLSRLTRTEMTIETVDLGKIANTVINELKKTDPSRKYKFKTQKNILTDGDANLLSILLENLLGNAWKFTKKRKFTEIEFGKKQQDKETVFFIRDNGAGFNMKYADKLFIPFQRLHDDAEYPGTGIGLGIVARIVNRHGGRIWAESEENKGTTFLFTLGGKTNE